MSELQLQSWLNTLGPLLLGVVNLVVLLRAKRHIQQLEVNTNHKMDLVLAAKDVSAEARVSAADAIGAERGRTEEAARRAKERE